MKFLFLYMAGLFFSSLGGQEPSPYSFHYFKDYPRVLFFIESAYVDSDLPENMIENSFQNLLWSIDEHYNLGRNPISNPQWEKALLLKWGMTIDRRNHLPHIGLVLRNSPADRAGLQAGDILLAVDGMSTQNKCNYLLSCEMLNAGSITLTRQSFHSFQPLPEDLTLHQDPHEWLSGEIFCTDPGTAEVWITELRKELFPHLEAMDVNQLVLDMRTCVISDSNDLIAWLDFFLPGTRLQKTSKQTGTELLEAGRGDYVFPGQLVLVVNDHVSGFSEIFCHAAKYSGCLILGQKTAGYPYESCWFLVDEKYSIEIACWEYGFPFGEPSFNAPVEPDIIETGETDDFHAIFDVSGKIQLFAPK
jgi:carboxyl-terminal processing protease